MGASLRTQQSVTLEEFLRMPGIDDEPPYLEYIDGRIEAKAMPTSPHNLIGQGFFARLDSFPPPRALGVPATEVRFVLGGRSILPDVSFQLWDNIRSGPGGVPTHPVTTPPDIHVEILSPEQAASKDHAKLLFSVAKGCTLGILVDPERRTIDVYRPGRTPERLADDGAIDFSPVLPGLVVPVAEVFAWMVLHRPRPHA